MARAARGAGGTQIREGANAAPPTKQQGAVVPFDQGSKPEIEPGPSFTGIKLLTTAQELGSVALPANGYIGAILIDLETTTAATKGAGELFVAPSNYPFNIFEQIRLTEPNGAPLGLELSGWQTMLANIYGGYAGLPDPRDDPDFKEAEIEPSFTLRLPIEIAPNALGALGNQSASAALRLTLKLNPIEGANSTVGVYKKAPTTSATFTIRTFIELWGEPPREDMFGRQIKQWPDYGGPGEGATAQYWSVQAGIATATAQNTIKLTRVGSQIRTLIFEFYEAGVRADKACPDPFEIQLDNRIFRQYTRRMLRKLMKEMVIRLKANVADVGIYAVSFSKGEHRLVGENEWNSWLATLTATRLELRGPAEKAGTVNILTNDISVTAPNPAERTVQVGTGGYHPPIGQTNLAAG
jgi:hypothetical protein